MVFQWLRVDMLWMPDIAGAGARVAEAGEAALGTNAVSEAATASILSGEDARSWKRAMTTGDMIGQHPLRPFLALRFMALGAVAVASILSITTATTAPSTIALQNSRLCLH
mmetsp:Transcript_63293/g.168549  ORF Transcript_63293/g.168549 Transcript_63293/m.168549 type:complete len:111 (-) Transcript_63293:271-603(-)